MIRRFALSDRCRYYWGEREVQVAIGTLVDNLRRHAPPLFLLSQFLPEQHADVLTGRLACEPLALIQHKVAGRLAEYARACARNRAATRAPADSNRVAQATTPC